MECNGVLHVLKPPGMTSFDVVSAIRRIYKTKKVGHTGTLDPLAAGVLTICIGKATKAIEYTVEKDKAYRAELTLGAFTDTQDSTGVITEQFDISVTPDEVKDVIMQFKGKSKQIPPMYSAIKVKGQKLYELARKGIEVEREPRDIEIYDINIIKIMDQKVILDVHCSKGTYIRTLCTDIGAKLGCGAYMSFLLRLKAGRAVLKDTITFESLAQENEIGQILQFLLPVDGLLIDFPEIVISQLNEKKFINGAPILMDPDINWDINRRVRVYNYQKLFLGVGKLYMEEEEIYCRTEKLFL